MASWLRSKGYTLIGMVHVGALPGTPDAAQPVAELAAQAREEAAALERAGFDAVMLENMHDTPYVHGDELGPEIVAAMTRVAHEVRGAIGLPMGLQILSGGNRHALAVALATGCSFIRCENFAFAHVADEGLLARAEAGALLRYRRQIGAEHINVFTDIKKKHASHAVTGDLSIADIARGVDFFGAEGIVVTGAFTGQATAVADLQAVAEASELPILVGSGVEPAQLRSLAAHSQGAIVGSWIKHAGHWANAIDEGRARELVAEARRIEGS